MRFEVLIGEVYDRLTSEDVVPCILVEIKRRFRDVFSLVMENKGFWNVGTFLRDYTAKHPRRQSTLFVTMFIRAHHLFLIQSQPNPRHTLINYY
jgi:hypothetical protein